MQGNWTDMESILLCYFLYKCMYWYSVNIESTWLYLQNNGSLLHVGMKQVPGEISTIIQAKRGDVV